MARMTILKNMVWEYRYRLALTYLLFTLEMGGHLLRPFFLGMAVDDLIKGSYRGLVLLTAIHLIWLTIGTIRLRFDTRTYTAIYTSLVTKFLLRRVQKNDVSKLSAHSSLARELVDFLEYDLIYIIEAFYNIAGSLILLFFYESSVVLICLSVLLPVLAVSYFYGKKMKVLNKQKNDELEKQVDIISTGNSRLIKRHYDALRQWQIRISDQEAWNFGIMEVFVILVIVFSLVVTSKFSTGTLEAGMLIGIYSYIQRFVSGLDTIPYVVQKFSSLKDIIRRIEWDDEKCSQGSLIKEVA
ncbi:MAG: ABC transporter six-transmembrane domain-containing protein [Chitinophagaceae bacterium]|nr:ABC transporter six-transmembrane domain-containing protein [Chitinophagaceae bacterium]